MERRRASRGQITLARALSKFGLASRTGAALLIREGRVSVNGRTVTLATAWIDPRADRIAVDGAPLRPAPFRTMMMHKPAGVVTSMADERGRRTVADLLPPDASGLFPVGRLDRDTTGLLLFTNDTRLGDYLTDPDSHVPKTYEVTLDAPLSAAARVALEGGLAGPDGTVYRPCVVRPGDDPASWIMTIDEGKNRQIRRMAGALGYSVVRLHRCAIGPLTLGSLAAGAVRALSAEEVDALKSELKGT